MNENSAAATAGGVAAWPLPRAMRTTPDGASARSSAAPSAISSSGTTGTSTPRFALYFAHAFFPPADPSSAQPSTRRRCSAAGFLIRPIGSWALGRFADRCGRKSALQLSILMMCAGSLIIAITPDVRDHRRRSAPSCSSLARLLQGFSLGGEYGTSATYLAEVADAGTARVLFELPVRHADFGAADRGGRADRSCSSSC